MSIKNIPSTTPSVSYTLPFVQATILIRPFVFIPPTPKGIYQKLVLPKTIVLILAKIQPENLLDEPVSFVMVIGEVRHVNM
ncbi:hypothetical protein F2Q69_00016532, partial [Brassica cretica]